ncbi:MAG: hypothetical protein JO102_00305, partial [Elusimicrobia bacterium]|nr:hypothetical protein [Elusimicrobiota bacterium]
AGLLFGIDRTTKLLYAADPAAGKFVAETALSSPPDYVRFVAPIGEVWVTEPRSHRIERFSVGTGDHVSLSKMGFIDVPGGPESLVVDAKRGRAYTNLWTDHTLAIDLSSAAVVASWPNTCAGSRGLAMDEERGYVLVGCEEGKAIALDAGNDGKIAGRFGFGSGVDIIGFNPVLRHLYLPGAQSATLAVILVRNDGLLLKLGEFPTVADAHCVTSDDLGQIWICDPDHGQILMMKDGYRGSGDK